VLQLTPCPILSSSCLSSSFYRLDISHTGYKARWDMRASCKGCTKVCLVTGTSVTYISWGLVVTRVLSRGLLELNNCLLKEVLTRVGLPKSDLINCPLKLSVVSLKQDYESKSF